MGMPVRALALWVLGYVVYPKRERQRLPQALTGQVRAVTWAVAEGAGFYEQITGRSAPEGLDNLA